MPQPNISEVRFSARLPAWLKDRLRDAAKRQSRTQNAQLVHLLTQALPDGGNLEHNDRDSAAEIERRRTDRRAA